jgi:hypothetical protein
MDEPAVNPALQDRIDYWNGYYASHTSEHLPLPYPQFRPISPDPCAFAEMGFPISISGCDGRDSISLTAPDWTVGFIRLRATDRTVLHLKYIEVFALVDGEERNLAPGAFLTVSSSWPGSDVMLREQWFLNAHENNYGFHTDEEDEPWAILALSMRATITRIVIHNRTDEFGARAWLLAVDVSDDGQV